MLVQVGKFTALDAAGDRHTLYVYRHAPEPGRAGPPGASPGDEEFRTAGGLLAVADGPGRYRVPDTGAVLTGTAPRPTP